MGELAKAIRARKYTGNLGKPKSIVLVGHSFGSFTSQALIASQPDIVKGVVLTGIAYPNATDPAPLSFKWILEASASRIANLQSAKWHDRDTGYLNVGDIYAHVNTFFKQPDYEVQAAEYAQSIAQPFTAMEFLSLQTLNRNSSTFKGAAMVMAGQYDFVVCGGECESTFSGGRAQEMFKGARKLNLYVHPGAGHDVNFGLNATGFYGEITKFLDANF